MSQVMVQVNINAPASKVWDVLVDSGSLSQWLPNSVDLDSLDRSNENGSSAKYYDQDLFSSVQEEAKEWDAYRSYSYVVNNIGPIKAAHNSFSLDTAGEETLLTQTLDWEMKYGPVGAMMDSLIYRPQFRKLMETSLTALKDFVEEQNGSDNDTEASYAMAA